MSVRSKVAGRDLLDRWPRIGRALRVDATGHVDDDFVGWSWGIDTKQSPAELAVAYEEWAAFYEWNLPRRAAELATDPGRYRLVEKWTDSMAYSCRRSAAYARGDDPGPVVPQRERRPDLFGFVRTVSDVDGSPHADGLLVGAGVAS